MGSRGGWGEDLVVRTCRISSPLSLLNHRQGILPFKSSSSPSISHDRLAVDDGWKAAHPGACCQDLACQNMPNTGFPHPQPAFLQQVFISFPLSASFDLCFPLSESSGLWWENRCREKPLL
ncbi:hypothetical protein P7K49_027412 [Saguinus oedipus]|uniref:Uncharacterized protein n=1 Tax=Saguinus oedipus TaxID=9490 RepID=A0ABQ9U9E2_SAGOE|nr:hypothetical protein P7K49_027412 [Saguinus oedipus]